MAVPKLFSDTMFAYGRSLDFRSMRHNLLSTNVANAETPGFKAKDVKFEKFFQDALSVGKGIRLVKTHQAHLDGGGDLSILSTRPDIVEETPSIDSFDGNSVSLDKEMTKLSENSLLYQTETDILARLFAGLRFAVTEGGAR